MKLGILTELAEESRRIKDKTVGEAYLAIPAEEALVLASQKRRRAPMQSEVLRLLASIGSALTKEISYFTGASQQTIRSMEKAGLIRLERTEVYRRPEPSETGRIEVSELTERQTEVFEGLRRLLKTPPRSAPVRRYGQRQNPGICKAYIRGHRRGPLGPCACPGNCAHTPVFEHI